MLRVKFMTYQLKGKDCNQQTLQAENNLILHFNSKPVSGRLLGNIFAPLRRVNILTLLLNGHRETLCCYQKEKWCDLADLPISGSFSVTLLNSLRIFDKDTCSVSMSFPPLATHKAKSHMSSIFSKALHGTLLANAFA